MKTYGKIKLQNKYAERFSKDKKWRTLTFDGMFIFYDKKGNKFVNSRIEIWGYADDENWQYIKHGNWYYLDGVNIKGIEENRIFFTANLRQILPGAYMECSNIEEDFGEDENIKVTKVSENEEIIEITSDKTDAATSAVDEVISDAIGGALEEDDAY